MNCAYCEEEIKPGERADNEGSDFHVPCLFRATGSIAHLRKRCSCFRKDSTEGDPPGLTRRQAATLAWDYNRGKVLIMHAIHDHPLDAPDSFVVSHWAVWKHSGPEPIRLGADIAPTLEDARKLIPEGLVCFDRTEFDDPKIVETWL